MSETNRSETKRSEMMKIHGSCHCGQIIFEAQANPARAVLCHCTDCQMMSGSPYRSIVQVKEADFSLLAGKPKPYFKVGDSGNRRELSFCANCGSHLYATSVTGDVPEGQRTFGIRTGLLRELAQLPPQAQVWCQSKVAWADDISHLPGVDQQS